MFKITCCRCGTWYNPNRGHKGCFVREFNSLSEVTKFWLKSKGAICFPNIRKELTKHQIISICNKAGVLHDRYR